METLNLSHCVLLTLKHPIIKKVNTKLTLKVLVATIDALGHFETG